MASGDEISVSGGCLDLTVSVSGPQLVNHKVPDRCVKSVDVVNPVANNGVNVPLVVGSCDVNESGGDLPVPRPNVICGDYLNELVVPSSDEILHFQRECSKLDDKLLREVSGANAYDQAALVNPSPLKVHMFDLWLKGYNEFDRARVMYNLKYGVRIPSTMPSPVLCATYNHTSALQNFEGVSKLIDEKVRKGIMAGPFASPPRVNYITVGSHSQERARFCQTYS